MAVKVRTIKELEDNVYSVEHQIPEFSGSDAELAEKFGEPEVQIGGTFTAGLDSVVIDSAFRKLPSGFPVIEQFHGSDFDDAGALASSYAATILTRITTAVTTLRANADTFSGESVTTL